MRKIEKDMVAAIKAKKNWKSGNTRVDIEDGAVLVRLHGNLIAQIGESVLDISDCGWPTVTTRSRLNAVIAACGRTERVYQAKGVQMIGNRESSQPFRCNDVSESFSLML